MSHETSVGVYPYIVHDLLEVDTMIAANEWLASYTDARTSLTTLTETIRKYTPETHHKPHMYLLYAQQHLRRAYIDEDSISPHAEAVESLLSAYTDVCWKYRNSMLYPSKIPILSKRALLKFLSTNDQINSAAAVSMRRMNELFPSYTDAYDILYIDMHHITIDNPKASSTMLLEATKGILNHPLGPLMLPSIATKARHVYDGCTFQGYDSSPFLTEMDSIIASHILGKFRESAEYALRILYGQHSDMQPLELTNLSSTGQSEFHTLVNSIVNRLQSGELSSTFLTQTDIDAITQAIYLPEYTDFFSHVFTHVDTFTMLAALIGITIPFDRLPPYIQKNISHIHSTVQGVPGHPTDLKAICQDAEPRLLNSIDFDKYILLGRDKSIVLKYIGTPLALTLDHTWLISPDGSAYFLPKGIWYQTSIAEETIKKYIKQADPRRIQNFAVNWYPTRCKSDSFPLSLHDIKIALNMRNLDI